MNTQEYYKQIQEVIIEAYDTEFRQAQPGHCMKITGLPLDPSLELHTQLCENYPSMQTFILKEDSSDTKYITATKLIELRNEEDKPLMVLIPSNTSTAAEDSYGNATFKEIELGHIEKLFLQKLRREIPDAYKNTIEQDIFAYLGEQASERMQIRYLMALKEEAYSASEIGNQIYLFELIPDEALITHQAQIRARLKINLQCVETITTFNKSIIDRVIQLPIEKNTVQEALIPFLKAHKQLTTADKISQAIYHQFNEELNFQFWLKATQYDKTLKLKIDKIESKDFKRDDNDNLILKLDTNTESRLKVRISTDPAPQDIAELTHFRLKLMEVELDTGGTYKAELKYAVKTNANRSYRDITIEIDPNIIEEGNYFIKVEAENDNGIVLNTDDDFKDEEVQREWEKQKKQYPEITKEEERFVRYHTTSESDYFYITLEEEEDLESEIVEQKKDKTQNGLQAYFKFGINQLKNFTGETPIRQPEVDQTSLKWLGQNDKKLNWVYHIRYDEEKNHNYQINIAGKLAKIEQQFLKEDNADKLGILYATLSNNPLEKDFNSLTDLSEIVKTELVDKKLKNRRKALFNFIRNSAPNETGIFETVYQIEDTEDEKGFYTLAKEYLSAYESYLASLQKKLDQTDQEGNKLEIQQLLTYLQEVDTVELSTQMPDHTPISVKLLTPLHPLRLFWIVSLYEFYKKWESKTSEDFKSYQKLWTRDTEQLFLGELFPSNNLLVLFHNQRDKPTRQYQYAGELTFGWGIYINSQDNPQSLDKPFKSIDRQLKWYFADLLNIDNSSRLDNDVNQEIIKQYIENYLLQHPYVDKLSMNIFNAGDAYVFAQALLELQKDKTYKDLKYEIRLFKNDNKIIEQGGSLKNLLNPEQRMSAEAEIFSSPSDNKLFPKLRFSINEIEDYIKADSKYPAHLTFLLSPFTTKVKLYQPEEQEGSSFILNTLVTEPKTHLQDTGASIEWLRYIHVGDYKKQDLTEMAKKSLSFFQIMQSYTASLLAGNLSEACPAYHLSISEIDQILIDKTHKGSDWVITLDRNLGPEIYDLPNHKNKYAPFLLDYVPGEELFGIASYLTTKPSAEIQSMLVPQFAIYGIDLVKEEKYAMVLEDLRTVSSSIILQLQNTQNKVFEVVGIALAKRVLEKKKLLENNFIIPLDLHENLFRKDEQKQSRADLLLVNLKKHKSKIDIEFTVLELKCRNNADNIKPKMQEQIENTVRVLQENYSPDTGEGWLTNELKLNNFKKLLTFYADRAVRYQYLDENIGNEYKEWIEALSSGYTLSFKKLGIIFDFSSPKVHSKEQEHDITFFTIGNKLIEEILNPDSDLNTQRLQQNEPLTSDFYEYFGKQPSKLDEFIDMMNEIAIEEAVIETNAANEDEEIVEDVLDISHHGDQDDSSGETNASMLDDMRHEEQETNQVQEVNEEQETNQVQELDGSYTPNIDESPKYDILIGKDSIDSPQLGILGQTIQGKTIAIDLNETNTISLFGVQGGGKSYTIGTLTEMAVKQFPHTNKLDSPLAGVIFHFSDSMEYAPEFTSMGVPNDKENEVKVLKERYGIEPDNLDDILLLTPKDKVAERKLEFPSIPVHPIAFNPNELSAQDWKFLLGAEGNESAYIKQMRLLMRANRNKLNIESLEASIQESPSLSEAQKNMAQQRLDFAKEYIQEGYYIQEHLKPGRLIIVDLRDEWIEKDEALGLFVVMLNIFSSKHTYNDKHFNKFIVFDEAHKYMSNKDLMKSIEATIRQMRHKGMSIMLASQDPLSLPNEIIQLSSIVILHKFNSPLWMKHIQKSITAMKGLREDYLSNLNVGEAFLWSSKASDKNITNSPVKIKTRPRITKHGGATKEAT